MLYVGLDVHQRSSMLCVLDGQGNERERRSDLDRLTEARKNVRTANPFAAQMGSQKWKLTVLGNWEEHQKELDGTITPNPYVGTGETEDRDHNEANEITNRYPQGSPTPVLPFAYDAAGNLRDQKISASTTSVFTHDAWNRLVKHIYTVTGGSSLTSIHYEYNGLHWRTINKNLTGQISEEEESGNSGTLKEMYYSAAWQLLEERIDEDCVTTPGTDRTAQEVWGLRYIDDAVMRTADVGSEKDPRRFYHLTDVQFSTVAMLPVGALRTPVYERVAYEPYGKATHRWMGDVNDDGAVNSTDVGLVTTAAAANSGAGYTMGVHSAYDVRMDINRDGLVDGDDEDIFVALPTLAFLGTGEISDRSINGPDNIIGYDGYVFAPELSRYCVRFRWYDPGTGRWLERDPAGTMNVLIVQSPMTATAPDLGRQISVGPDLYEYVRSAPHRLDPLGLDPPGTQIIALTPRGLAELVQTMLMRYTPAQIAEFLAARGLSAQAIEALGIASVTAAAAVKLYQEAAKAWSDGRIQHMLNAAERILKNGGCTVLENIKNTQCKGDDFGAHKRTCDELGTVKDCDIPLARARMNLWCAALRTVFLKCGAKYKDGGTISKDITRSITCYEKYLQCKARNCSKMEQEIGAH